MLHNNNRAAQKPALQTSQVDTRGEGQVGTVQATVPDELTGADNITAYRKYSA